MTHGVAPYARDVRLVATLALLLAVCARADDPTAKPHAPDVDVVVPVDPHEHERVYWFGGRGHHVVPGTVTINTRDPYRCDVDGRRFPTEDEFVAHLKGAHRIPEERIPDAVVVRGGLVHFVGEPNR